MDFAKAAGYLGSVVCACVAIGCTREDGAEPNRSTPPPIVPGLARTGDELVLQTDPITVEPGQERYMCWTARVSETVKVTSYSKDAQPFVHHVVLSTTTTEEPDGMRECDALFQLSWRPLFAAGAGKVELAFPPHVVQSVDAGAQVVVQLHLLNLGDKPLTDSARIAMTLTDDEQTENVRFAVFGNSDVALPPEQPSTLVTECQTPATTRTVGFFPHMHMLGTSMTFELGPSADSMQTIYARDPYDFGDQRIDSTDMVIEAGQHARLTCNYNNTTKEMVTYGESSFNEMCFLISFVVGPPAGCIRGSAPLVGGGGATGPSGGDAGTTAGCPNVAIMGAALPGCCTPEGMCGIDASQFTSTGCVELGAAADGAAKMGYPLTFPAPRACGQAGTDAAAP